MATSNDQDKVSCVHRSLSQFADLIPPFLLLQQARSQDKTALSPPTYELSKLPPPRTFRVSDLPLPSFPTAAARAKASASFLLQVVSAPLLRLTCFRGSTQVAPSALILHIYHCDKSYLTLPLPSGSRSLWWFE